MTTGRERILVIDDDQDRLDQILAATRNALSTANVTIDVDGWSPAAQEDPLAIFRERTSELPVLVASDMELTSGGLTGLFGSTIVAWCQQRAIPVCGYTQRKDLPLLTKEPDLFEFRVADDVELAGSQLAGTAAGFIELRNAVRDLRPRENAIRSPTELLAVVLGRPELAAIFSLYASRLASSNSAILDMVRRRPVPPELLAELSTYVSGHLLANAILRFPGPIASLQSLCAYLALPASAGGDVANLFARASYSGPFRSLGSYYWVDRVDEIVDELATTHHVEWREPEDEYRRMVIERHLEKELGRHDCGRCAGARGGYWCPFQLRPTCERADCSVPSSSLVPQGAGLTRIERDYYEEWVPLLGL